MVAILERENKIRLIDLPPHNKKEGGLELVAFKSHLLIPLLRRGEGEFAFHLLLFTFHYILRYRLRIAECIAMETITIKP